MNRFLSHPLMTTMVLVMTTVARAAFAAPDTEQDILFSYAPSYAASVGGEDNAEVIFANVASGVNSDYDRSGTGAKWHIAGFYQSNNDPVNWTTTGGMVGWLANNDSRVSDVVSYGSTVGADLVCYVVQNSDGGSGGVAAVAQEPGMYSVVNPGNIWHVIFAHEGGGHNYGCHHGDGRLDPKTIMMHNYCGGGAAPPYFYSSPNIFMNGVQLIGDGSSCLGDGNPNGGDNAWRISSYSQTVSDRRGRPLYAPVLDHTVLRWQFNHAPGSAPASTSVADVVSSAPAVVRGNGATFTGSALRIPGGTTGDTAANSIAAYIDLPNGILSSRTNITIEIWATPLSAPNWARIMDFGRTTQAGDGLGAPGEYTGTPGTPAPGSTTSSDDIMLSAANGTDIGQQRFEAKLNGAAVTLDSALATTAGVQHHFAITFADGVGSYGSAGGRWQWYRDGEPIAYLDVNYHLSSIEDVNNWLGRSQWSDDAMANNDYAEVRVSDVAMSREQVVANFLIGPNYDDTATVMMTGSDAYGTTSFNAAGHWSSGSAPSAGNRYETFDFWLRTPATASSYTFGGDALTVSGGALLWKGTSSSTITVNELQLNGGTVLNAGSGTFTLAGSLTVTNGGLVRAANGPVNITANLSGNGPLSCLANTVTLSGNNSGFTGKTLVGSGMPGSMNLGSEAQLGANPGTFTADQLTLNRGWLYTTASMAIDDSNRGIEIGVSGGIFNTAPGTTLTIPNPISSRAIPSATAGLLIKANTGTLVLSSPNNTHNGPVQIDAGTFRIDGAGRLGSGSFAGPIINNATFIYNSSAAQTLSGVISGSGTLTMNGSGTLTLSGANTLSGAVTVNAGTLYANPGNAANNRALSYVSGITVNGGATLRSGANGLFGWDGTQEKPVTVNVGGTLTADGGATGDVGVGTVTLAGGTLASLAASPVWGSWRFDNAGDKLAVTQNSTVSAVNVKFANGGAIDVAAGKTLSFAGTITDASSGGASSLVKSGGAGTLVLSGANPYSGTTAVNAGTMLVNGSIGSGAVTVGAGATLGGNGTVNGATTVNSGGTISPGASIGRLAVNNSVTLQAGSTTLMEINKASLTNDQLGVTGTLTYGGTLEVNNVAGTLAGGDRFRLFEASSAASVFAATNLPALAPGLEWNFHSASGMLSVVATTPTNLSYAMGGGNITLTWPADHTGWRLETQTNTLSTGLSTNWFTVPGSAGTNAVVIPVSDDGAASIFYRLVYP